MKGEKNMCLYDLLILLKKCSCPCVNVFIVCENDKVSYSYHGFSDELLEKIKKSLLYHAVVVNYVDGYSIKIVCVL